MWDDFSLVSISLPRGQRPCIGNVFLIWLTLVLFVSLQCELQLAQSMSALRKQSIEYTLHTADEDGSRSTLRSESSLGINLSDDNKGSDSSRDASADEEEVSQRASRSRIESKAEVNRASTVEPQAEESENQMNQEEGQDDMVSLQSRGLVANSAASLRAEQNEEPEVLINARLYRVSL